MMLQHKNIVVLGGTGHIGSQICEGLIELGATVFSVSRFASKYSEETAAFLRQAELTGQLFRIQADMNIDQNLLSIIEFGEEQLGVIHGWVNCANSSIPTVEFDYDRVDLSSEFENLISIMMATKYIGEYFKSKLIAGSIVNISSIYAHVSPIPALYLDTLQKQNPVAYGVGKAGLEQFSRFAAMNLAKSNIRVNSVVLGPFPSAEVQRDSLFLQNLKARIPLGRVGSPSEAVGAVSYLLSDFSTFTTGSSLFVDGGWSAI